MADVLVNAVRSILVVGALLLAVEAAVAGSPALSPVCLLAGLLMVLEVRAGFGVVAVVAFGGALAGAGWSSHHTMLLGWVAAALFLFIGDDLAVVLRVQIAVLYLFAGLNKINEHFLTGGVFEDRDPWLIPERVWVPAAIAGCAIELFLAVAVWRRWSAALPLAVALHVGIVAGWMVFDPLRIAQLVLFNGLAVALVAASRSRRSQARWVMTLPTGSRHVATSAAR